MENSNSTMDIKARESRGWEIARTMNDGMEDFGSLKCRQMLAEYFSLNCRRPSVLHSFILKIAAKMAVLFPDFHYVSFFSMWGWQNIREEDSLRQSDGKGRTFPSALDYAAKGYAFSQLFHLDERLTEEECAALAPILTAKGYKPVMRMVATKVFEAEVRGRKLRFVKLVAPDGTEASCEIHILTKYQPLRYGDIPGMLFDVLATAHGDSADGVGNTADDPAGNGLRVVGAVVSKSRMEEAFTPCVGYVEHVDVQHRHVHVYDRYSRHLVAEAPRVSCAVGDFIEFFPIVPAVDKFKSAIINKVLPKQEGAVAFGLREVKVYYSDSVKGYCSWELTTPDTAPRTRGDEPLAPKGYITLQAAQTLGVQLPMAGNRLKIVVFMKRGKDKVKRPCVVWWMNS